MIYVQWSPPTQVYFGTVSDMYFDNLPDICSDISSTIYWFYLAFSLTWWLASCLTFYVAYWVRRPQRTCELAISTSWREGPQAILKSRDLHLAGGELEVEQPMKTYNLVVHCRCAVGHVNLTGQTKLTQAGGDNKTKRFGHRDQRNGWNLKEAKHIISYHTWYSWIKHQICGWAKPWCLPCVPPVRWAIDSLGFDFWDDQATISQMPPRALGSLRPLPDGARFIALHCWGSGSVLTLMTLTLHDQRWMP